MSTSPAVSIWTRVCLVAALLKVMFGLAGLLLVSVSGNSPAINFSPAVFIVEILAFAASALLLVFFGSHDRRAVHLGALYLINASSFADTLIVVSWMRFDGPLQPAFTLAFYPPLYAFAPYFMWQFVSEFPRVAHSRRVESVLRGGLLASCVAGWLLFLANTIIGLSLAVNSAPRPQFLLSFIRQGDTTYFWAILYALLLSSLPVLIWRAKLAPVVERRRFQVFLFGIVIGTGPILVYSLLAQLIPSFRAHQTIPWLWQLAGMIFYPLLLLIPFITAYSVLMHQVLDVRLIIRKTIQYAFARGTVVFLTLLPFSILLVYLYENRTETLANFVSGGQSLWLVTATSLGLITYRLRTRLTKEVDRYFFREQYDSQLILSKLVDSIRFTGDISDLVKVLTREIDRALHVSRSSVLTLDPETGFLREADNRVRPLNTTSQIIDVLEQRGRALDVSSLGNEFGSDEKLWLADSGFKLLVPMLGANGSVIGLICLGEKKSELPFSRDDCTLLISTASSCGLTIENRLLRTSSPFPADSTSRSLREDHPPEELPGEQLAGICRKCKFVQPASVKVCPGCGIPLSKLAAPYMLAGKFRFEREIGSGGMGVVYQATDIGLRRRVAIKTLPRMSSEACMRLFREARAMAAVIHPNLATIYGAETWKGTPMLIFEFLGGGTLAQRLRSGPLEVSETIRLGLLLADALEKTHARSILHRDIKPSNIGFADDGTPKLLDFGLSRILNASENIALVNPNPLDGVDMTLTAGQMEPSETPSRYLVGTPAYLAPEALKKAPPDPSCDLWSLSLVLYEGIAGCNPFAAATVQETLERVSRLAIPDLRVYQSRCPASVALFFHDALSREPGKRPATPREFKQRLMMVESGPPHDVKPEPIANEAVTGTPEKTRVMNRPDRS